MQVSLSTEARYVEHIWLGHEYQELAPGTTAEVEREALDRFLESDRGKMLVSRGHLTVRGGSSNEEPGMVSEMQRSNPAPRTAKDVLKRRKK